MRSVTDALNDILLDDEHSTGGRFHDGFRSLAAPIDLSAAMEFSSEETLAVYHQNKFELHRYSRDSNTISLTVENVLKQLNGGYSICFNNGMAAIWSVLWSQLRGTREIITVGAFYRKTLAIIEDLVQRGIVVHKNFGDDNELFQSINPGSDPIIFIESPSNPLLKVSDIQKIRQTYPTATIVYDNTASGLGNEKFDISANVDFLIASATKYIGGHNDILAGYVTTFREDFYEQLWNIRSMQGNLLDSFSSYLLLRSLKTFDLRFRTQCDNACTILHELESWGEIKNLYYPGKFANSYQSEIVDRMYYNFGSMITFECSDDIDLELNNSRLLSTKMAPSFGSTDTLIERPATMSHSGKTDADLAELGLSQNLIRLSVGLEDPKYILTDLKRIMAKK